MSEYKKYEPNHSSEYKQQCWDVAIGLQAVDDLKVPDSLTHYAKQHIDGHMSLDEIKEKIYQTYKPDMADPKREKEASLVSVHIAEILNNDMSFNFSPIMLKHIHKSLFNGVYDHAGKFRTYNFTKDEPILNNRTVSYADYRMIQETFSYDFEEESLRSYVGKTKDTILKRISKFTSDIWQVHAFCEGNTRTTAVFMELYLRNLGFRVNNDTFKEYSKYFRNALVRANFADYSMGIDEDMSFLIKFYDNLLFEGKNLLQNRDLYLPQLFPKTNTQEEEQQEAEPNDQFRRV